MAVARATSLRPQVPLATGAMGLFGATPAQLTTGPAAYSVTPIAGDTLPVPPDSDLVLVCDHLANVVLGVPLEHGRVKGQRVTILTITAQLELPADPSVQGAPVTATPSAGVVLVWTGATWILAGSAGGNIAVSSVFGRLGPAVVAADGDYTSAQVVDSTPGLAGTRVSAKLADAKAQIDAAQGTADGAVLDAAAAQGTANTALADAAAAQTTADGAVLDAAAAQGTANTALANAATAQGTANAALAAASAATGYPAASTIWVDPAGSALAPGTVSSQPTTLDHALAVANPGDTLVLQGGTHTLAGPVNKALRLVATSDSVAAISSAVTVTAPGVEMVGLQLLSTLTDSSAAAGTTRLTRCTVSGAITVPSPAAVQVLELSGCTCAAVTVSGASGGATVRIKDHSTAATVTHAATGAVTCEVYQSTIVGILCTGGGGLTTIGWDSRFTGAASVNVAAGTATATTLAQVRCGSSPVGSGVLILTSAPVASVRLAHCEYNLLASTIPVNSRVVAAGDGDGTTVAGLVSTTNTPANPVTYLTFPAAGALRLDPLGIYEANTNFTFSVTSNNTAIWADLLINGVAGPIGALQEPLGTANAQSSRGVYAIFPGSVFGSLWSVSLVFARSTLGAVGTVNMLSASHGFKRVA